MFLLKISIKYCKQYKLKNKLFLVLSIIHKISLETGTGISFFLRTIFFIWNFIIEFKFNSSIILLCLTQ